MKRGKIFLYDTYAGLLTEDENGFTFVYDAAANRDNTTEF